MQFRLVVLLNFSVGCDAGVAVKKGKAENIAFGKRLKAARIAEGLKQERFAELADISVSFLNQLEHGTAGPSLATLKRIREVLHVPLDYLVTGEEPNDVTFFTEQIKYLDPDYLSLMQDFVQKQMEMISFCEKKAGRESK